MTTLTNFAVYKDNNCYITKFTPVNNQVILVRCLGETRGPFGHNKLVAGFSDNVCVAMPKLVELTSLQPGCLYALKATGVHTKGKYTVFGFEVAEISVEQYKKMLGIVEYVDIVEGIYQKGGTPKNIINMVEDPLPSTSSSVPTSSEYMNFQELYQVFKKIGSSVKYYSEDHYVLVHQYKHRINETKAGYRRSDVQAVVNKIVGE